MRNDLFFKHHIQHLIREDANNILRSPLFFVSMLTVWDNMNTVTQCRVWLTADYDLMQIMKEWSFYIKFGCELMQSITNTDYGQIQSMTNFRVLAFAEYDQLKNMTHCIVWPNAEFDHSVIPCILLQLKFLTYVQICEDFNKWSTLVTHHYSSSFQVHN